MIPKIYKSRSVSYREAQLNFEEAFRGKSPAEWSDMQIRQIAHIIKWASVSFNLRESVKLSKSLIVRELGQRGYLSHIHSVFPVKQGHNLGTGAVTVYDYRGLLKTLVKWIKDQGMQSIDEFKILLGTVLSDIEKSFRKKMGWFFKMVTSWFGKFTDLFKVILREKNVTTIQESSIIRCQKLSLIDSAERRCRINQTRVHAKQ